MHLPDYQHGGQTLRILKKRIEGRSVLKISTFFWPSKPLGRIAKTITHMVWQNGIKNLYLRLNFERELRDAVENIYQYPLVCTQSLTSPASSLR